MGQNRDELPGQSLQWLLHLLECLMSRIKSRPPRQVILEVSDYNPEREKRNSGCVVLEVLSGWL